MTIPVCLAQVLGLALWRISFGRRAFEDSEHHQASAKGGQPMGTECCSGDAERQILCANRTAPMGQSELCDKHRVLITTYATHHVHSFARYTLPLNANWALRFNHSFVIDTRERADGGVDVKNAKVMVKKYWVDHPSVSAPWLLWIGADASFVDFGEDVLRRTLTEYAAEQVQVLISRDPHGRAGNSLSLFNADVILIRRSSWSSQFLQRWWDDPRMKEGWTDQEVLELLYKEDVMGAQAAFVLLPPGTLNSDSRSIIAAVPKQQPVVHLGGHGDTVRLEVFRRALELLCEDQLDRNSLQLQDTYLDSLRRVTTQPEGTSSGHLHSSVSAGHFQRLAWHLEVKGRVQEALAVQEAALQHAKRSFGSSDPQTLLAEVALGTSLRVAGRGSEAAQLLAKSCKKLPARDKFTCVNNLALALGSIGRHQEAEVHFHKAHRGIVKVLGHDSLAAANVAVNLASSMAQRQAHREAEPFYRSAWSTRNASLGATHPETLEVQGFLAASLLASGRPREAEQVQRQALPTGASPEVLAQAHSTLGQALRLQGKVSEALEHFRVAYETFQSPPEGNRNPNMFAAASNLASVLQDLGRLDEAAPLYELAVLGLEETLGVDHQNSQGARQNYEKFREMSSTKRQEKMRVSHVSCCFDQLPKKVYSCKSIYLW
ncbi:unnamed protein product [Durusdinium trenchii]|uniref:Uncharacterized protein n=1 Tax=Durusdinium trenchii TaxID=1381693 RepID=A0ABP0NDV9_9DINO